MPAPFDCSTNSVWPPISPRMPHREIDTLNMKIQGTAVEIDLSRIPGPHKHIALVPQWDFLELLAAAAEKEPTFRLLRSTEVLAPIPRGDQGRYWCQLPRQRGAGARAVRRVDGGLRRALVDTARHNGVEAEELRGADGRVVVSAAAKRRRPARPCRCARAQATRCIAIDRGDYFQIAYIIPKGRDAELRAQGIETLHRGVGDTGALAGRSRRRAHVVRRRQAARRSAQPAAALVHRRTVADRRRGARHVTGRRGRDQPGRRRRRCGRPRSSQARCAAAPSPPGSWRACRRGGGCPPR